VLAPMIAAVLCACGPSHRSAREQAEESEEGGEEIAGEREEPLGGGPDWAAVIGGPGKEVPTAIATAGDGSVVMIGELEGTADVDPGEGRVEKTSVGDEDVMVVALDSDGRFRWAFTFGSAGWDRPLDAAVGSDGSVVVVGGFERTADLGGGNALRSRGERDAFAVKLDARGQLVWARSFGSSSYDAATAVALGEDGKAYIACSFQGRADFDPGPAQATRAPAGRLDACLWVLDADGALVRALAFGGPGDDGASGIAVGPSGVALTGLFTFTVDFDPRSRQQSVASAGHDDVFLALFDREVAELVWVKRFGGRGPDSEGDVTILRDGLVVLAGAFVDSIDLDPTAGEDVRRSRGDFDHFVVAIDGAGQRRWAHTFGSEPAGGPPAPASSEGPIAGRDRGGALAPAARAVVLSGGLSGRMDVDPGDGEAWLEPLASHRRFVTVLDAGGRYLRSRLVLSQGHDTSPGALANAPDGTVVIAEPFDGRVALDPTDESEDTRESAGGTDAIVMAWRGLGRGP